MLQRNIRKVAAAAALATALAVTAPVQAASGRSVRGESSGWFRAAVHWVAHLLPGSWAKMRDAIDPDGLASVPTPPQAPDKSFGIDPDG